MISKIHSRFESRRKTIIDTFKKIDDDRESSENEWNVLQIAQHCNKIEKQTIKAILEFSGRRSNLTIKNQFNAMLLSIALKSRHKFKVPTKMIIPDLDINRENMFLEWMENEKSWAEIINSFQSDKKLIIFYHPIAGKLNLTYTLRFIIDHHEHHLRQVKHLL